MTEPTQEQVAAFLASRGLMVAPAQQPVAVGAQVAAPLQQLRGWPSSGGGGARFTGVTAGCYMLGGGQICVNGKGQVTKIIPGSGPDGNLYDLTFGVGSLAGTGATVRYLWPGAGRTIAQTQLVGQPAPVASMLTDFYVHQQRPPSSGAATQTYDVLVAGVPVATLAIPVTTSTVQSVTGLAVPVAAGARVTVRATRSGGTHGTIADVLVNLGLEVT
jgi:hypothetical protein